MGIECLCQWVAIGNGHVPKLLLKLTDALSMDLFLSLFSLCILPHYKQNIDLKLWIIRHIYVGDMLIIIMLRFMHGKSGE